MKLDRNVHEDGRGKYALLKLRQLELYVDHSRPFAGMNPEIEAAIKLLDSEGILDWGGTPETEFFVIRLRDKFAAVALDAYAADATAHDPEYAAEVREMASRAGPHNPFCKIPD